MDGVEGRSPRRLEIHPVLFSLPALARHSGRGHALSYAGGERMFVDFSGDRVRFLDPETGETHEAEVFVSVLGASGILYAEATRGQDLDSWLSRSHPRLGVLWRGGRRHRAGQLEVGRDQGLLVRPRGQPLLPGAGPALQHRDPAHENRKAP